jgi:tetratricopeptide (TPR) repeat protein
VSGAVPRCPSPLACGSTFSLALSLLLLAATARADDRAIAEQAFEQGRELMAAGRYAEACQKFEAAAGLSPTAGVRLNLAECYTRLGRLASAWAKADEALAIAERASDAAAADLARRQKAALGPRLSHLIVSVDAGPAPPKVTLDGKPLPEGVWGTSLPVDPGDHAVVARRASGETWSRTVTVGEEGGSASVTVPAAQGLRARAEEGPQDGRGWSSTRTLALVSGGLGVVGLGIGAGFALDAAAKKSQYEQHQQAGRCVDTQCVTISQGAVASATVSTVAFTAGAVLSAAGVTLWLLSPSAGPASASLGFAPEVAPSALGATFRGVF